MSNPMSDPEYAESEPSVCPFCRQPKAAAVGRFESDGEDTCRQEVTCRACGRSWRDVYRLAGYEAVDGEGNAVPVEGKPPLAWTVVGACPPGRGACLRDDTFVEVERAETAEEAAREAVLAVAAATGREEEDIAVLAVFEGALSDVWKEG